MESWIVLIVVLLVLFAGVVIYNSLVQNRIKVKEAFSTIDVYLKKRYDLIPNLVETVKGYASHEKETLENVIQARNMAMASKDAETEFAANNMLSGTLKSLFALAESYPDLKANASFLDLQGQLSRLEDELALSRKYYNGTVRDYNTQVAQFPSNLIAGMTGFRAEPFYESEPETKETPEVRF